MKIGINILILFCFAVNKLPSQNLPDSSGVYAVPEKAPEFPGGITEMAKFIQMNLNYPWQAREAGASGKTFLKFIVDTSGALKNITVANTSGNEFLDKEAIKVISFMPKWDPALEKGKKVNAYFMLPVSFKIMGRPNGNLPPAVPEKTLTAEEKVAEKTHEKAMHFYDLGVEQARQERWEYAVIKFDQCLKYEPKNEGALYNKTVAFIKLKKTKDACDTWALYKSFGYSYSEQIEGYLKPYCKQ